MMMNAAFVPGRKMSLCWLISLTSQGFPVSIPEGFNADNSLQSSEENKAKRRAQWKAKRESKVKWSKLSTPNRMKGSWLLPLVLAFLSHAVVLSLVVISALCQLCSLTNIWPCTSPINKKNLKNLSTQGYYFCFNLFQDSRTQNENLQIADSYVNIIQPLTLYWWYL